MSLSREEQLWEAATEGDLEIVKKLAKDPSVNLNFRDSELGRAPFYRACGHGRTGVVAHLLTNPRLDPNLVNSEGATPFCIACSTGHTEVVALLLGDPRINVNQTWSNNGSPLWLAAQDGFLLVVQHMLASGRNIDTTVVSTWNSKTAAEQARAMGIREQKASHETEEDFQRSHSNGSAIADLLDKYDSEPERVRRELRQLPGVRKTFIGHVFALVVFFTDDFVRTKGSPILRWFTSSKTDAQRQLVTNARRFFVICSKLPLELQMVVCCRMYGSGENIVLSTHSEPGFQLLARPSSWH